MTILHALLLTWSLVPLAAMLVALGAAAWLRQGERGSKAASASLPGGSSS